MCGQTAYLVSIVEVGRLLLLQLCLIQDECSFVSLRDVERAMIVFENLHDMMEDDEHSPGLGTLMDEWAKGHRRHIGNEDEVSKKSMYTYFLPHI